MRLLRQFAMETPLLAGETSATTAFFLLFFTGVAAATKVWSPPQRGLSTGEQPRSATLDGGVEGKNALKAEQKSQAKPGRGIDS